VPTIREQLIGTWRLVSYETVGIDGSAVHPMGRDAVGFIMYLPDGFMSANLMVPGRTLFTGGAASTATQAELSAASEGYFGYAGQYEVDETEHAVRHHIELALVPNLVGSTQLRRLAFKGTRLILEGEPVPMAGRVAAPIITWQRVDT
jgi:Lipocalin-like domain